MVSASGLSVDNFQLASRRLVPQECQLFVSSRDVSGLFLAISGNVAYFCGDLGAVRTSGSWQRFTKSTACWQGHAGALFLCLLVMQTAGLFFSCYS